MSNDKFINVYIDILQKTLNDWLLQNVSLQANARVSEDVIQQQAENIEELNGKVEELDKVAKDLQQNKQNEIDSQIKSYKDRIENLENAVRDHLNTISSLNTVKSDYDNVKNQVQNVDSIRNELIKTQKELEEVKAQNVNQQGLKDQVNKLQAELTNSQNIILQKNNIIEKINVDKDKSIAELKEKIDYLQLTPAKRKKFDEERAKEIETPTSDLFVSDTIDKDGGSF
jgi:DNA repair exonuclease SbcCD ATPase subunit